MAREEREGIKSIILKKKYRYFSGKEALHPKRFFFSTAIFGRCSLKKYKKMCPYHTDFEFFHREENQKSVWYDGK